MGYNLFRLNLYFEIIFQRGFKSRSPEQIVKLQLKVTR